MRTGTAAPPVPKATLARIELAENVLRLRDEQLNARVVYFEPQIQTNAELDAITAQVVAELQSLQKEQLASAAPTDPAEIEIALMKGLRELLEKMVSARREAFLRHKIETIQRKITNLFFTSEIYANPSVAQSAKTVFAYADEALFHVLHHNEALLVDELRTLNYRDEKVKADAVERLHRFSKMLVSETLARSRPELERLLMVYRDVLLVFLMRDFRESLGEFSWEVVRESRVAHGAALTYKIQEASFPEFRKVFERKFLDNMLSHMQAPLAAHLNEEGADAFRPETLQFAADPRIYAEICAVWCNAIYAYLHGEGWLDLPVQWQQHLANE
ncbi:MAG: hypothetical protein H6726_21975 [Sandaracinaceae bacterium]|nr:hypothetical protein [Myxococcales bacterium]MCB9660327.1 hypothetical protein [Sandaracinaceae bacterium]